jgi:hypothetical protein
MGYVYVPGIGYISVPEEYYEPMKEAAAESENVEGTQGVVFTDESGKITPISPPQTAPQEEEQNTPVVPKPTNIPETTDFPSDTHDYSTTEEMEPDKLISFLDTLDYQQLQDYLWWKARKKWEEEVVNMDWFSKAYIVQLNWLLNAISAQAGDRLKLSLPNWVTDRTKAMFPILANISIPKVFAKEIEGPLIALLKGMLYAGLSGEEPPVTAMWQADELEKAAHELKASGVIKTSIPPNKMKDILPDLRQLQSRILGSVSGLMAIPFTRPVAEILFNFLARRQLLGSIDEVKAAIEGSDLSSEDKGSGGGGGGGSTIIDENIDKVTAGVGDDELTALKQQLLDMEAERDLLSEESQRMMDEAMKQIEELNLQLANNAIDKAQYLAMISSLNRTVDGLTEELRNFIEDFDLSSIPYTSLPTLDLAPMGGGGHVNCELIVRTAIETGDYTNIPPECTHLLNETLKENRNHDRRTTGETSSPRIANRLTKRRS